MPQVERGPLLKKCGKCRKRKPLDEFNRNRSRPDGLQSNCKLCHRAEVADYLRRNPQKHRERDKRSYWNNREKRLAANAAWARENPERIAANSKRSYARLLADVVEGYGGACTECGCDDVLCLTFHHVNGDGRAHRAKVGGSTAALRDARKRGFPPEFTILCANCHLRLHRKEAGYVSAIN